MAGIESASGRYIVMGDADQSYDFGETPKFVAKLDEGYDLVQGSRPGNGSGRLLRYRWVWSCSDPQFAQLVIELGAMVSGLGRYGRCFAF